MKDSALLSRGRLVLGVCLANLALVGGAERASAQQGAFVEQASARLVKLINDGNAAGYSLHDNTFAIGGGWLKQGTTWVNLFSLDLAAGKQYRFVAAGDNDARDVDLEVVGPDGSVVAADTKVDPTATVDFGPGNSGRYLVRVRVYGSRENLPAVCVAIVMSK